METLYLLNVKKLFTILGSSAALGFVLFALSGCEAASVAVSSDTGTKTEDTLPVTAASDTTATPETAAPVSSPKSIAVAPSASPSPSPSVTATPIALTYYKQTVTRAPVNGWVTKTYTSTGYCTTYQNNTYCWDDGVKTLQWVDPLTSNHYGPYTYSYWNVGYFGTDPNWTHVSGVMTQDLLSAPTLVTAHLTNSMTSPTVNTLLTNGAQMQTTCTESGGVLSCADFTIDLNQAHL